MKINYLKKVLTELLARFTFTRKVVIEYKYVDETIQDDEFYDTTIPDIDVFAMVTLENGDQTLQDHHPEKEVEFFDLHVWRMKDGHPFTLIDKEDIPVLDIRAIVKCLERRYQTTAEYL